MKLIGFLGSECYDIIKLTAIVAKHFDAKILLIDVSANESLKNTFSDSNVNEFNLVEQNGVFFYNHNLGPSGVHPKEYDYVFIDCPPVDVVADANVVSEYVDMALFVVRAGMMKKDMLPIVDTFYNQKKFPSLSLILNGTSVTKTMGTKYGYGYGYGYGNYIKE